MAHKQSKEIASKDSDGRAPAAAPFDLQNHVSEGNPEDEVQPDFSQNDDDLADQQNYIPVPITLRLSRSLLRKLNDNSREEGVSMEELASELVAEGVVLRAWEIVEKKAAMRGGNANANSQTNFNRSGNSGNSTLGNQAQGNHGSQGQRPSFQSPGNKMAQKKLQRQARQHANAMDLMSDKAAFLEYVRNQEKKRR